MPQANRASTAANPNANLFKGLLNMNSTFLENVARLNARELRVDPSRNGHPDILTRGDEKAVSEEVRRAVVQKIGRVRQYAPRACRVRVQFHEDRSKPSADQYRVTVYCEAPGNDVLAERTAMIHSPRSTESLKKSNGACASAKPRGQLADFGKNTERFCFRLRNYQPHAQLRRHAKRISSRHNGQTEANQSHEQRPFTK
jgi:ribosome-associated translation inhibitor RaiA